MLTVVWDVDDILNDLMHQWFLHGWLTEHPDCSVSYEQLSCNPPHTVLGVGREDYLASMDRFRESDRARNMTADPDVLTWFREQGYRFRHIALTARPLQSAPEVARWVIQHFGAWIRCFGVVPTRTLDDVPVYDRTKGEYLAWLGRGDILVDDSTENVSEAALLGLKTFQPARPWNNARLTLPKLLNQLSQIAGAP